MTVEELIKDLMKIPNQQMPVFFETEEYLPESAAAMIEGVSIKKILSLRGDLQGAILSSRRTK